MGKADREIGNGFHRRGGKGVTLTSTSGTHSRDPALQFGLGGHRANRVNEGQPTHHGIHFHAGSKLSNHSANHATFR